jgi:hypothetical protein
VSLDFASYAQMVGYRPHSEQLLFHNSNARFRVPVCGRRFGKSTMAARDMGAALFRPDSWYWIVAPTYDLAEKEFRVIWNDLIIGRRFGKDKRVRKAYNKKQGEMYIQLPWGTRLECRSARHPDTLVGEGLDGVIMSEAAKHNEETWRRHIRPALSDKRGWATFPTTPEGYNWLYKEWQYGNNPEYSDYESWSFPSWKNTEVYPLGYEDPEIQKLIRTTSKEWFDQEIGAKFSSFVGKIYGEFQEMDHVRHVPFRPDWPNYITFDWGFTNPLAAIEFQVGPNDQVHVWREHYRDYTTIPEHCAIMKAREQPPGYRIDGCFGDAADPAAAATVGMLLHPCMTNPEAKENWREGVELVKSFLKTYQVGVADEYGTPLEEPKMKVDFGCVNVIAEFNNYKAKKPASGNNVPEMGQRVKDHALDALRYGLMHVFKLGATHHLSEVLAGPLASAAALAGSFTATQNGLFVPSGSSDGMAAFREASDMGIFRMGGSF